MQSKTVAQTLLYYLGLSALITHEMDAVINMEWRLLYHLRDLPDVTASAVFIGLHFPMFFLFFFLGHHKNEKLRDGFRNVVSLFLIIHAGLHFRLSNDALYQFEGFASNFYIYSAALFGVVYLLLNVLFKSNETK